MSNNLPEKLRTLAQRKGEKLTARDAAVLVKAAHMIELLQAENRRMFDVNRDGIYEVVDVRARLNALVETLGTALDEARE